MISAELDKDLGKYLADCRRKKGLTQRAVGYKMGYTTSMFISNLERGLCSPRHSTLYKYCRVVGADKNIVFNLIINYTESTYEKLLRI